MSLMDDVRTPINGHPVTPPTSNRRAERRADKAAEAEQRRADEDARARREREDRDAEADRRRREKAERAEQKRKDKAEAAKARARAKKERRAARRERLAVIRERATHHMPASGLIVAGITLVVSAAGQVDAATRIGMDWAAFAVPALTEGMVLTFASLTMQAIDAQRPYRSYLIAAWVSGIFAAALNAAGHLVADSTPAGMVVAGAFAAFAIAGLATWAVVMRSRQAKVSGKSAAEATRWRAIRRRHPVLYRRAQRLADRTGRPLAQAWPDVWSRAHGAAPDKPSIREIRSAQRATYCRALAEEWDGRTWLDRRLNRGLPSAESASDEVTESPAEGVPAAESEGVPTPVLPVALLVPGASGQWVNHPVPVRPLGVTGPVPAKGSKGPTALYRSGFRASGGDAENPLAEADLSTVRTLADELGDASKLSARNVRKRVGCRSEYAVRLRDAVKAERGVER